MMPKVTKEGTTATNLSSRQRLMQHMGKAPNRANTISEDMTSMVTGDPIHMPLVAVQGIIATAIQQPVTEEQQHITHLELSMTATLLPSLFWAHSESFPLRLL